MSCANTYLKATQLQSCEATSLYTSAVITPNLLPLQLSSFRTTINSSHNYSQSSAITHFVMLLG